MASVGALHSLRSFRRRLPWALGIHEQPPSHLNRMYSTVFIKYVFDSDHEDTDARFAVLTREELLPFAPQPGQEVQWPLERSQKILSSTWSTEHKGFRCRVEDECTVNIQLDAPDFDEYLEDAPERGWKIANTYPAK